MDECSDVGLVEGFASDEVPEEDRADECLDEQVRVGIGCELPGRFGVLQSSSYTVEPFLPEAVPQRRALRGFIACVYGGQHQGPADRAGDVVGDGTQEDEVGVESTGVGEFDDEVGAGVQGVEDQFGLACPAPVHGRLVGSGASRHLLEAEPLVAPWGAFHDLLGVAANLAVTGAHSAPPFQVPWVFGISEQAELARYATRFSLDGVAEKITCPLLVIHGAADRQVPLEQAKRTIAQATNAARRDLVVFETGDWGDQHCQVDDPTFAIDLIADWLQEVLQS